MSGDLSGKVALVTGAAQGIGAAIATRLAEEGARVAVNDVADSPKLRAVCEPIGALPVPADVSDEGAVLDMVKATEEGLGNVDILVCNAALETLGDFPTQSKPDFWRQIEINLTGGFICVQAVLPSMRRRGRGKIVIISSIAGVNGWERAVGYSASKGGLIALTKALGDQLAPENIFVNSIAPGAIDSPQIEVDAVDAGVTLDELRARYAKITPLGRIGRPEEIAGLAAFLVGPHSDGFIGQILQPNGGLERGAA